MKVQYPKYLYLPTGESTTVGTIEAHESHSAHGWMTADEYDALASAMPTAPQEPPSAAPVDDDAPTEAVETPFGSYSAADAVAAVKALDDVEMLRAMRTAEENRAGGGRKTVLRALADKLGAEAAPATEEPVAEEPVAHEDEGQVTATEPLQ